MVGDYVLDSKSALIRIAGITYMDLRAKLGHPFRIARVFVDFFRCYMDYTMQLIPFATSQAVKTIGRNQARNELDTGTVNNDECL